MNARDPSYRPDWPEAEIELWSWALNTHPSWVEERRSEVVSKLAAAGFTIMSKEDVEAVRDKALEEAAREADTWNVTAYHHLAGDMAYDLALAIRSLKSKEGKVDS